MASSTPPRTTLGITGRFGHLRHSASRRSPSRAVDAAAVADEVVVEDTPVADEADTQDSKLTRTSEFFQTSSTAVKQEQKDEEGQPSPSKSGYFSPAFSGQRKKRKAEDEEGGFIKLEITPKKVFATVRPYKVYEDLNPLTDNLSLENDIVFCGINPGVSSAQKGHHYAGPTNRFWPCIHQSGIIPEPVTYKDDARLPSDFNLGLTNLVSRPTAAASELSSARDMRPAVPALLAKIRRLRPQVVCFVGKDIWREVQFVLDAAARRGEKARGLGGKGKGREKEKDGWDGPRAWKIVHDLSEDKMDANGAEAGVTPGKGPVKETYFWAVSSTSGLCRDTMEQRLAAWRSLSTFSRALTARRAPDAPPSADPFVAGYDLGALKIVDAKTVDEWVGEWNARLALKAGEVSPAKG